MSAVYTLEYLADRSAEEIFESIGNYYVLADGSTLELQAVPAWCHECGRLTAGERVESFEEMDRDFAEIERQAVRWNDPDFYSWKPDSLRQAMLESFRKLKAVMELRRKWRQTRISPPHCIACGSTHVFVFPMDQQVSHPSGKGLVKLRMTGFYRPLAEDRNKRCLFTPEGVRVR